MHVTATDEYSRLQSENFPEFGNWFFRYWSHVVNCSSCKSAYKGLSALEIILQFASLAFIGIAGATKHKANTIVAMAVVCFACSKWLNQFIYKSFHYQDYDHAFHWGLLKICLHWWAHDPAIVGWHGISSHRWILLLSSAAVEFAVEAE